MMATEEQEGEVALPHRMAVDGRDILVINQSEMSDAALAMAKFGLLDPAFDEAARKQSLQLAAQDEFDALNVTDTIETPTVKPDYYSEIYRLDDVQREAVDQKANDIAGSGYMIRPRYELFPRKGEDFNPAGADPEQQHKIYDFLDSITPTLVPFDDVMVQMVRDLEAVGQGCIEVGRNNSGDMDAIWEVKGSSIRIAKGGPERGFYQHKNNKWRLFVPYGADSRWIQIRIEEAERRKLADTEKSDPIFPVFNSTNIAPEREVETVKQFVPVLTDRLEGDGEKIGKAQGPKGTWSDIDRMLRGDSDSIAKANDDAEDGYVKVKANELIWLTKGTTADSNYGDPQILSAIHDQIGSMGVKQNMIAYFDNATVPRVLITITGPTPEISDDLRNKIENFFKSNRKIESLHRSAVLGLNEGEELNIERLSSEHLDESETLNEYRESTRRAKLRVNRCPVDWSDEQALRRYIGNVVRPSQRRIEYIWNTVFKRELDANEWVIDFELPEAYNQTERYEQWDIGLRRGVLTINEVRTRYLKLPRVEGGDQPMLHSPGMGIVRPSDVAAMGERIRDGEPVGDELTSRPVKTPPKGQPIPQQGDDELERYGAALLVPIKGASDMMSREERELVATVLKPRVFNPDDVDKFLGLDDDE